MITNLLLNSSSGLSFMFKLQLSIFYTKINDVTFEINQCEIPKRILSQQHEFLNLSRISILSDELRILISQLSC